MEKMKLVSMVVLAVSLSACSAKITNTTVVNGVSDGANGAATLEGRKFYLSESAQSSDICRNLESEMTMHGVSYNSQKLVYQWYSDNLGVGVQVFQNPNCTGTATLLESMTPKLDNFSEETSRVSDGNLAPIFPEGMLQLVSPAGMPSNVVLYSYSLESEGEYLMVLLEHENGYYVVEVASTGTSTWAQVVNDLEQGGYGYFLENPVCDPDLDEGCNTSSFWNF